MKRSRLFLAALVVLLAAAGIAAESGDFVSRYRATLFVKQYEWKLKRMGLRPEDLRVHVIGQSHIDAAWKWRVKQTRHKVFQTWGQAIRHMDVYPEFMFSGSAPQYYEWIMEDHSDLFRKIVEREKEGRWEIVGGQWVEPDGNMPDGESVVRQRLYGQRFYLEHFGKITEVEWMLDSFGYNWNYPQIVARSGGKYMWTSKLTWNDTTVFPFHNFWWRGPDGSQVVTHICPIVPLPTYFPYAELGKYRETRRLLKPGAELVADYTTTPEQIDEVMSGDWLREVGVFYGLGDGGLGPRKIEIEIQKEQVNRGYAKWSTGLALFQDIAKCADRFPVWATEMYLEFHRGTLTTQAWIKRANRKMEQALRSAETLRSFLHVQGVRYPAEGLLAIWKLLLLNQFHDILPGSSIPEVYWDAKKDFDKMEAAAHEITYGGMQELAKRIKVEPPEENMEAVVVFNALAWQRTSLVKLEVPTGRHYQVVDKSGADLPCQELKKDGKNWLLFMAKDMPAAGYRTYFLRPVDALAAEPLAESPTITEADNAYLVENEFVKVAVDKKSGLITSLIDKASGTETIERPSNKLLAFHDHDDVYSAWNIMNDYLEHPIPLDAAPVVSISAQGPLYSEVRIQSQARFRDREQLTTFDQRVRLMAQDPVVQLDLSADMHMDYVLVKLEFNTKFHGTAIPADNAYVVIERPTHPATAAEKAQWELPCHKWIDMSDSGMGLALLNNGKYGFSLNEDGAGYRLSVIKAAHHPKANFEAKEVKYHYYSPFPTLPTDQGAHYAELGLLAHAGDWREAKLWEAGYNFNTPMDAAWTTAHKGKLPDEASWLWVDGGSVIVGSVKKAEDDGDLIIRLVEVAGAQVSATVNFGEGLNIASGAEVDLLEMNPQDIGASGSSFTVDMGPYQIRTFKLKIEK